MRKVGDNYAVQPVMKALQVLEYVARQGHDVTLTETVQELKLPKTTVFRYLQTLSVAKFLEHEIHSDRYRIGSRFRALAQVDRTLQDLKDVAQHEMRGLADTFKETINLAVMAESQIVYIDMLKSGRPQRSNARIGHRHPLHSTSLGKAIYAYLPDTALAPMGPGELPAKTIKTLTDFKELRRQVGDVRLRGYAIEIGENEDGLMCIGVPVLDHLGFPVAAMSISAPERRMPVNLTVEVGEALKSAAGRISLHLARYN